jgi:hypothetical protein
MENSPDGIKIECLWEVPKIIICPGAVYTSKRTRKHRNTLYALVASQLLSSTALTQPLQQNTR